MKLKFKPENLKMLPPILGQQRGYSITVIFWLIAILCGFIQGWVNRYSLSSEDGVAYLDIADAYLRGDWNAAINAYWSPLYSWFLSLAIFALKPSAYWEFPVVKLVNFLMFLAAIGCFEFFLRELIAYYDRKVYQSTRSRVLKIPKWAWIVSGYSLFIWSSLEWIGIDSDTPDMATAALVYLASGLVLRISISASWFNYIALGLVLGFGYLSKSVMFPLAFVFLGVSLFSVGNFRQALPRVFVASLVFTIVVSPFLVAISTAKGHFTFSETGKLNYAWYVNPEYGSLPDHHWQGKPADYGTPKHPSRKIFDSPEALEFGTPVPGTYPPWHDPSYWYEGLKTKFSLVRQLKTIVRNFVYYYQLFLGVLIFTYLIFVCMNGSFILSLKALVGNWRLLIPAVAGLGIYMIVISMPAAFRQTRYIAPFIVLLFAGVFSSVRLPDSQESKRFIAGMSLATLVIPSFLGANIYDNNLDALLKAPTPIEWQVADRLKQLGIQPGDKVAHLGDMRDYYWARLAGVKVVAEIYDGNKFWAKDDETRAKAIEALAKTGAKVLVHKFRAATRSSHFTKDWQKIGKTGYYVYFLPNPSP